MEGMDALLEIIDRVCFNNNGSSDRARKCAWDLDPSSKQSFLFVMKSRAGWGTKERPMSLSHSPCFSFHAHFTMKC